MGEGQLEKLKLLAEDFFSTEEEAKETLAFLKSLEQEHVTKSKFNFEFQEDKFTREIKKNFDQARIEDPEYYKELLCFKDSYFKYFFDNFISLTQCILCYSLINLDDRKVNYFCVTCSKYVCMSCLRKSHSEQCP